MNFTQLQLLLQNDELHYISDSTQFFIDNQIKSKQFKEQKNYYDPNQAEKEFSDMLQSYGMFGESQKWIDYIKESGSK